jgi:excisionase family DNA binding protein
MSATAADRKRRAAEAMLEVVRGWPEFTIPELAEELGRVEVDVDLLAAFRAALDIVIDDRAPAEDPADTAVWGPAPSPDQLALARERGDGARREALGAVLADALTRDQVAQRLGISAQAVSERLKAGTLTALRRGREWRFPAWQFGDDAALPALREVIAAWPGTTLSLSTWALRSSPDLSGRSPAQELARRGGATAVLELVEAIDPAGW